MISLKKYMDEANNHGKRPRIDADEVLPLAISAYRSALIEIGSCGRDACPGLGDEMQQNMERVDERLEHELSAETVTSSEREVREQLRAWGSHAARHMQSQTGEIKELLLVMARTAEAVGERDQRCAKQLSDVTIQLQRIATLEDITQIRASIKRSAQELKTSVDKMAAEGKAAVEKARAEITTYQNKLEEAEQIASRDSLTGMRSRLWVENMIERRIESGAPFALAVVDLNGFKKVNDEHGHLAGDDLLKQFATELKSACRSSDVIGRWGGDEFIIVLDCNMEQAQTQVLRLREWSCGDYTLETPKGPVKLPVSAAIGLAEFKPGEKMKDVVAHADAAMYKDKSASGGGR